MFRVKYIEKGPEHDFKRIDHDRYIIASSYFKSGSLYYFRVDEFNYTVIADEDIIEVEDIDNV